MNTPMTILLRMLALSALAATLLAQRPGPRAAPTLDPTTAAQNQVTRLTALLGLTSAQAAQATTIFTNSLTAVGPLQTTMRTNRQSLETAITTNALSVIEQVSANIGTLQGQITAIQSRANAAFYAILTPTQQAKVTQMGGLEGPVGAGGPGPGGFPGAPGGPGGPNGPAGFGRGAGRPLN